MNLCQGVPAWLSENSSDVLIFFLFSPQPILQFYRECLMVISKKRIIFQGFRRSNIFQGGGGGSNFFKGGGGVPSGNFYRNPYNLWFSRGGGPEPLSPPLNPHMIACKCKLLCNKFKTESESHTGRCINYIIREIWLIDVTWLLAGRRSLIMVLLLWVLWNVLSTAISSYHTAV